MKKSLLCTAVYFLILILYAKPGCFERTLNPKLYDEVQLGKQSEYSTDFTTSSGSSNSSSDDSEESSSSGSPSCTLANGTSVAATFTPSEALSSISLNIGDETYSINLPDDVVFNDYSNDDFNDFQFLWTNEAGEELSANLMADDNGNIINLSINSSLDGVSVSSVDIMPGDSIIHQYDGSPDGTYADALLDMGLATN